MEISVWGGQGGGEGGLTMTMMTTHFGHTRGLQFFLVRPAGVRQDSSKDRKLEKGPGDQSEAGSSEEGAASEDTEVRQHSAGLPHWWLPKEARGVYLPQTGPPEEAEFDH